MSGGKFNYVDGCAKCEIFGYGDKPTNVFEDRELSEMIWDVFDLIHDFDWYVSGDTSESVWLDSKKAFKEKWLSCDEERVKRVVDNAINEVREELYKTYQLSDI